MVIEFPKCLIQEVLLSWNFCADNAGELAGWSLLYQLVQNPFPLFPEFNYCGVVVTVAIAGKLCKWTIFKTIIHQKKRFPACRFHCICCSTCCLFISMFFHAREPLVSLFLQNHPTEFVWFWRSTTVWIGRPYRYLSRFSCLPPFLIWKAKILSWCPVISLPPIPPSPKEVCQ